MAYLKATTINGLFSVADAARTLGVLRETLRNWITQGWVEAPSVQLGKRMCYTAEQVERIAKLLAGNE